MMVGDGLAALAAAAVGYGVRFGTAAELAGHQLASAWIAALLPLVWVAVMAAGRTYDSRYLWIGAEEFRRVFRASVLLLAMIGTVSWALTLEVARGLVVIALPLATLLTLLQRYGQRSWLHRQRARGRFLQSMLVVGHSGGIAGLHVELTRDASHGYRVVGCCTPTGNSVTPLAGHLPVLGSFADVVDVVVAERIDTVAVLPSPELDGAALRRLGWSLEATDAELLLAPAVTQFAGPRVNIRPISGLPLLHMDRPELRGIRRVMKEVTDRLLAGVAVILLLPVLAAVAVAVRVTSPGPVFFRQERVGRSGEPFVMLKFRTMIVGADRSEDTLVAENDGNGVLFKLKRDPRVTSAGRLLRRLSLDELPQLFNVLRGEMSLVGPRPPLAREVERYGMDMRRRFLVKPGLTGLWQISGRSDLSWDESVRMDVHYVENWSLALDFMIIGKTFGAVMRGSGAY